MPFLPVENFDVNVAIKLNSTVKSLDLTLHFNNEFKLERVSDIEDTALFYPLISISPAAANKLASQKGFTEPCLLGGWDQKRGTYYYRSSRLISTQSSSFLKETREYNVIEINAGTGSYRIVGQTSASHADGFISDFSKHWQDTIKTKPGWKTTGLRKLVLNVPETWLEKKIYGHRKYPDNLLLMNEADTINIFETCVPEIKFENESDQDYQPVLRALFPGDKIQGRSVSVLVKRKKLNLEVRLSVIETGTAFNCGPIVYHLNTSVPTDKFNDLIEILKTLRFTTY